MARAELGASRPQYYRLQVGPSTIAIEGSIDPDQWSIAPEYAPFVCPAAQPDLILTVLHGPAGAPGGSPAFHVGELASIYRDGASWIFRIGEEDPTNPVDRVVTLDPSGETGTLVVDLDQSPWLAARCALAYPLDDLLFRHLLTDRDAVIVHACGVAWQGRGFLFVGSSGAGKSTAARLWKVAGAAILNDDRVVLEASKHGVFIHPTPWSGEYPEVSRDAVPLAGLYLIRKGFPVTFEEIPPARAVALLYAKSFPPLWDAERLGRTLDTLDRVCRRVPYGWLTVPPDQRAVEWVQAGAA
jgi:hypothetical protein